MATPEVGWLWATVDDEVGVAGLEDEEGWLPMVVYFPLWAGLLLCFILVLLSFFPTSLASLILICCSRLVFNLSSVGGLLFPDKRIIKSKREWAVLVESHRSCRRLTCDVRYGCVARAAAGMLPGERVEVIFRGDALDGRVSLGPLLCC